MDSRKLFQETEICFAGLQIHRVFKYMARGIQQLYPEKPLSKAFYKDCNAACDDILFQQQIDPNSLREPILKCFTLKHIMTLSWRKQTQRQNLVPHSLEDNVVLSIKTVFQQFCYLQFSLDLHALNDSRILNNSCLPTTCTLQVLFLL